MQKNNIIKRARKIAQKNDRIQLAYDAIVYKLRQENIDAIARLQIAIDNNVRNQGIPLAYIAKNTKRKK